MPASDMRAFVLFYILSFHLSFKFILVFFGARLVYFVEEKSEHFANCFSSDRIK